MRALLPTITLLLTLTPNLTTALKRPSNAILLSNVKTLTLRADQKTTAGRVSPIPQLTCIGGNARKHYNVDVMRCTNSGSEYSAEDVSWTCQASLPPEFKLGSTEVICEGYESADDPYVLRGSCGVEYRLVLTEQGEEKYGVGWGGGESYFGKGGEGGEKGFGETVFTMLFWAIFIGIIGLIAYSIFTGGGNANVNIGRRGPNNGGGWGGGYGGDDNDDDPPPPYTPRGPRSKPSYSQYPSSSSAQQGWRPGFWSGAAAGAAGAYAMGNRNRGSDTTQAGPSNWFGGGGGRTQAGPSNYGGGGGASSSSPPSSSRYESTGFGGTRRR